MAPDNVDVFKSIVFRIPSFRSLLVASIVLGFLYSGVTYGFFTLFMQIPQSLYLVPYSAIFIFILPMLLSSELLYRFLPDYPRRWGYFLGLSNQFFLFVYASILSGADNLPNAWSIIWLGLITIFAVNLLVLLTTLGGEYMERIGVLSLVHPVSVLATLYYFLSPYVSVPGIAFLHGFGILFFSGFMLFLVMKTGDYLFGRNVSNVSIPQLTSGLLQKKQEALDIGYEARPDVQTFMVENEEGKSIVAVPWVHPGPLEGFGGGQLTDRIISYLNGRGEGFMFHVPSSHKSDLANPEDNQKIIDAIEEPETEKRASRLYSKSYKGVKFWGRRFGGKKIVYMDVENHDDYDMAIFRDVVDREDEILVDLHSHIEDGERNTLDYYTEETDRLRELYRDFVEELEDLPLKEYRAGFESRKNGHPVYALVEEVNGQSTLLFGVEGNAATPELKELEQDLGKEFDEARLFTTDTHASVHELARDKTPSRDEIEDVVLEASRNVSNAGIGMTVNRAESLKLLGKDYLSLIFSINILIRLLPIFMVLLYLGLIIMIFW